MKFKEKDRIELKFRLERCINECYKKSIHKAMKKDVPNFWTIFRDEFEEDILK